MPNIKFDRLDIGSAETGSVPLASLLPADTPFLILGSVREEEEPDIRQAILELHATRPDVLIGLFPRHMQRIGSWSTFLQSAGLPWVLRSRLDGPATPGSVVLWDVFGELGQAYALARTAFVGGTLRPLGGQNFLEPLACGIAPIIGPHWDNFAWVGEEFMDLGLAIVVRTAGELAAALTAALGNPLPRAQIRERFAAYVAQRRGGAAQACALIAQFLPDPDQREPSP